MRILHVAEVGRGGVITVMDSLIAAQCQLPQVVEVIRLCAGELTCLPNPKLREIRYPRSGRNLASQWALVVALARALMREAVDVVHLHSTFAGGWGRLLATVFSLVSHKPVVVYTPHGFSFLTPSKLKPLYGRIEQALARRCDAIVCVSEHERQAAIMRGLPLDKLRIIRNGVPAQPECAKLNDEHLRVLFVGRFDHQKGFDLLQRALHLVQRNAPMSVRAVGAPDREESCDIPPRATMDCLGWLAPLELEAQYRWADVVVVPSRWEAFAMVPLEAMSFGCAVVATDCCSLPEAIEQGVNGALFAAEDAQALASILSSVPACTFRRMGRAGAARQRREFELAHMSRTTAALYDALKASSKAAPIAAHDSER
ncbi:MAG: glycosyl transferase family 1 [Frankiales bacterium]|nr:glycosyl transferase family 1 [Frankiales bacterium]